MKYTQKKIKYKKVKNEFGEYVSKRIVTFQQHNLKTYKIKRAKNFQLISIVKGNEIRLSVSRNPDKSSTETWCSRIKYARHLNKIK